MIYNIEYIGPDSLIRQVYSPQVIKRRTRLVTVNGDAPSQDGSAWKTCRAQSARPAGSLQQNARSRGGTSTAATAVPGSTAQVTTRYRRLRADSRPAPLKLPFSPYLWISRRRTWSSTVGRHSRSCPSLATMCTSPFSNIASATFLVRYPKSPSTE